ncbi:aminodeoxychorismate synthase component I [Microlunatus soli]|uniref:aminodeoxychorismate synthase component I n=1 Tax=Microlunatus soli TaxID=630515 RepID=UPI0018D3BB34|nr:aminodeoxychorismate synthase component I [Microlunatus soli]
MAQIGDDPRPSATSAAVRTAPHDAHRPVARFDDLRTGTAVQFDTVDRDVLARTRDQVLPALAEVDAAVRAGNWAFGYVGYEAASGLDPRLVTRRPDRTPLLWFGITSQPPTGSEPVNPASPDDAVDAGRVDGWQVEWTATEHAERVAAVRQAIAAGDTYQCNLTTRLDGTFTGDPLGYYRQLAASQHGSHHAYLDTGDLLLISASPELFFAWADHRLEVKPMKGTAARGLTPAADARARTDLLTSAKDRAENVMIVDLIRNDIARIARPGTVLVDRLADCEKYDTVWQLTSTVSGQTPTGTTLADVFTALFPCGSITGAPKQRTMELIAELETSPRGAYCGTIGYLEPATVHDHPRARFNVAIRTVEIDAVTGRASYGVGGGVTWASTAPQEYAELLAKAAVLRAPAADFALLETFGVRAGVAVHLDQHLDRIERSARYFDIPYDAAAVRAEIARVVAADPRSDARARLTLDRDGRISLTVSDLPPAAPRPVRLAIDTVPIDIGSRWVYHKTTMRQAIDDARHRHPDADDVALINGAGRVTETLIANLGVRIGGTWYTPPVSDGCLPGIGRRLELEAGRLRERSIMIDELVDADEIVLISSLRGRRKAVVAAGPGIPDK